MSKKINVFVLAAGRGERLRPVSDHIPKPLVPVLGKPIIERVLDRISGLNYDGIGINLHYKSDEIERWIKESDYRDDITLFREEPVLGTGGALKNAETFLIDMPFMVHNSDILSDIPLGSVVNAHLESDNMATLAIHEHPRFNNLCLDADGLFQMIGHGFCLVERSMKHKAFTGIAVYDPEFLTLLPEGVSSVVPAWERAVTEGYKIGTYDVTGCYWTDIGSPDSYARSIFNELRFSGETIFVHHETEGCTNADIHGFVVLERSCRLDQSVSLNNCIVLPGGKLESDGQFENAIIGKDYVLSLKDPVLCGLPLSKDKLLIGTGGSDRRYYRIQRNERTAVLMQCDASDPDYDRHMGFTRFFGMNGIPVPALIEEESEKKRAIFEDLGDLSLYNWLKCPRQESGLVEMYQKVMDILVPLHTKVTENVSECPMLKERTFDYDHFRWETHYFIDRFVKGLKMMHIQNIDRLGDEFRRLATNADSHKKSIIHRDFQSQNIMISRAGLPRIIDFQGARMGPPAYDVASILWDPYVYLDGTLREQLVHYYMDRIVSVAGENFDAEDFNHSLLTCRLQRHMQALGAYAFLSGVKGKRYFLKYVPHALELLREDVSVAGEKYPGIRELISQLI